MNGFELLLKFSELENHTTHLDFSQPEIVDITEFDGTKLKIPEHLWYFKKPKSYPLDLNKGFDKYIFRDELYNRPSISKMEGFLMKSLDDLVNNDVNRVKICTQRSVLYQVMCTPYGLNASDVKDWTLRATKFGNVLYLVQDYYDDARKSKNDTYHFKFVQYCFSDSPITEPDTGKPVNENQQTYCVYRSQLDNIDLLYSAEINGVISDKHIDLTNLVELNSSRFMLTKLAKKKYNSWQTNPKVLRWWLQAHLSNVSDICIGLKQDGLVRTPVQIVAVKDLPRNQRWKPDDCFKFLHTFLNRLQKKMSNVNCPYTTYTFQYDSSQNCVNFKINEGKTKFSFLTENFIASVQKQEVTV